MTTTGHHPRETMPTGGTARDTGRFPRIVAGAAGAFLVAVGVWAMVAPESFFDALATFDPYNRHLIQDIGAFQIGLGAVLLLAVLRPFDALTTALAGVGIGSAAHVVSHVVGVDLGGTPETDIPFFTVLTLLLLAGAVRQWRSIRAVEG